MLYLVYDLDDNNKKGLTSDAMLMKRCTLMISVFNWLYVFCIMMQWFREDLVQVVVEMTYQYLRRDGDKVADVRSIQVSPQLLLRLPALATV